MLSWLNRFGQWLKTPTRTKNFDLSAVIFFAVFVLVMWGSIGEGQASFLNGLVRHYIEESSASLAVFVDSGQQDVEVNSLTAVDSRNIGQGGQTGPASSPLEPMTIQENSILAYAPASDDYLDHEAGQRSQVLEYTVQEGDLLSFIASDYGVSTESILWANNLKDPHSLRVGQVLKIPPVSGVIHKIKQGETISTLAQKYGIEQEKIIEFNSLPQGGQLAVGDELMIPGGKPLGSQLAGAPSQKSVEVTRFSYLPDLAGFFMIPTAGFNWGRIHGRNGVDMANSCNTAIYAAAEGQVTVADGEGWNSGFGKYIKISHPNGTETLYSHANKILVAVGEFVSKGHQIALMGTTGKSTGCHLHFEVHGAKNPLAKY